MFKRSIILTFSFFIILVGMFACAMPARASTSDHMNGWAWSDGVGWISTNCTEGGTSGGNVCASSTYGVNVDYTTGNLSGYSWSDNIGWISFNASATSGCPVGTCQAKINGNPQSPTYGALTGWARACSVFASGCSGSLTTAAQNGGWDGFISLNCSNGNTCGTSNYALTTNMTTGNITGYAWGSTVVGWVQSYSMHILIVPVTVDVVTANPSGVPPNQTSVISWTSTGAGTCFVTTATNTGTWVGYTSTNLGVSGSFTSQPLTLAPNNRTFAITCTPLTGFVNASDSVTVGINSTAPFVTLTANPTSVLSSGTSTLTWTSGNVAACSWVAGDSIPGAPASPGITGGNYTSQPLTATHTQTISCTGLGSFAGTTVTAAATVAINSPAPYVTLSASPTSVTPNATSVLTWTSGNVSSCSWDPGDQVPGAPASPGTVGGSYTSQPLIATHTQTISCIGAGSFSGTTVTATATVTVVGAPSCSLVANPATVTIDSNAPAPVQSSITLTPANGYNYVANFNAIPSDQALSASFSPTMISNPYAQSSILTITPSGINQGNYNVLVTADGVGPSCTTNVAVDVLPNTTCNDPAATNYNQSGSCSYLPTVTLYFDSSTSPATVVAGTSHTLTWTSTNAMTCTASASWGGASVPVNNTSPGSSVTVNTPVTYSITCTDASGSGQATSSVSVNTYSPVSLSGGACIASGSSAVLSWMASGVQSGSCSLKNLTTNSLTPLSGSVNSGTSNSTQPLSPGATTSYTLNCTTTGGSPIASSPQTIQVGGCGGGGGGGNTPPVFEEF